MNVRKCAIIASPALGLALTCAVASLVMTLNTGPASARVMGGGDPTGCYSSQAEFATPFCQGIHAQNAQRVVDLKAAGYACRKDARNWTCNGAASIIVPHEGRLTN